MPYHCCAPKCRGNYDSATKVSVFKFPDCPEMAKRWVSALKRDFTPTKHSRVCELHFAKEDILHESSFLDERTGRVVSAPLKYPRLKSTAVPSKLPGCPSYLSKPSSYREDPQEKRSHLEAANVKKAIAASIESNNLYESERKCSNLEELKVLLSKASFAADIWTLVFKRGNILFLNLMVDVYPSIEKCVVVNEAMEATAYMGKLKLKKLGKFSFPFHIDHSEQIHEVLHQLEICNSPQVKNVYTNLVEILVELKNHVTTEMHSTINFIEHQVSLIMKDKNHYRYSNEMMIYSSLLYSISPHAYKFLRNEIHVILPHPSTIHALCSPFVVSPVAEQQDEFFLCYAKQRFTSLKARENIIALSMDEIYLKPYVDYKGGNIVGMAYNNDGIAANTAYVFMANSYLSGFKEVVNILPIKKITAENLFYHIRKVVVGLEGIGYVVLSISSDNNAINGKAMSFFSNPPKLSVSYHHPVDPERPLFFIFDPVHILKCVRNNWINQKNPGQCMYYTNFENANAVDCACFQTIKQIHALEDGNIIKYAYGITLKSLSPSNMERQNVKLVLQIFNEHVIEGLRKLGSDRNLVACQTTAEYIKIFLIWWKIMNVKTLFKGEHKRDPYQSPITANADDVSFAFLSKFLNWVEIWRSKKFDAGVLTRETFVAVSHTTRAVIQLVTYCQTALEFKYLLTGKLQTDCLERHFGKYRSLSGSQYSVSLRQIFETETKLRLQNIQSFKLHSSKHGDFNVDPSSDTFLFETDVQEVAIDEFKEVCSVSEADKHDIQDILPILIYISGYCVHSVIKKLKCLCCKENLTVVNDEETFDYVNNLNRGGLSIPQPEVVDIVIYAYIVVQKLVSAKFETNFLKAKSQRNLAIRLIMLVVLYNEVCLNVDVCSEGHTAEYIVKYIITAATNTFLNNYCKARNDKITSDSFKKRKLQTVKNK